MYAVIQFFLDTQVHKKVNKQSLFTFQLDVKIGLKMINI